MLKYLKLCITLSIFHVAKFELLELTDDTFKQIDDLDTSLVMFYAPWCGHCKKLKPEFKLAAEKLGEGKNNDEIVNLVQVDCTGPGKSTCDKHGVSGYPTLKIFKKGDLLKEYQGPRDADGIVKYMKSQLGPSSKELTSLADYDSLCAKDETLVLGYFEKESDLKGEFIKAADSQREKFTFAHTSAADIISKEGHKDNVKVCRPKHLHNKFEDNCVLYKGDGKSDDLKAFIKNNYLGLVGVRTNDNTEDFKEPLVIAYFAVDYVKNPKGTHYWRNRVLKVAKKYSPKMNFAVSNKEDFRHEIEDFKDALPAVSDKPYITARDVDGNKYVMTDEFSVDNLDKFVKDVLDGKLEPHVKSEPIPEDNSGPVKMAVGKNFHEVVTNSGKDVLVEFYAPWCGHCKKLEPVWTELAEKLKNEDIVVAKMDATANDWPKNQYQVSGFPTIYWRPKDSKPVRYEGGRSVDDFIKYVAEHATSELKGWDRKGKPKKEEL